MLEYLRSHLSPSVLGWLFKENFLMKTILLLFVMMSALVFGDVTSHFFLNGKAIKMHDMPMLNSNQISNLEFYFTRNKDGEVIKDFKVMHGKLMHMVIVKQDLSHFKHIHPYFDPVTGRFQITINIDHADPDNFATNNVFDGGGMYMVMVDIEPKGIGMRMFHHHVHVMGETKDKPLELQNNESNDFIRYFENDKFQAHFNYSVIPGCKANIVQFDVTFKVKNSVTGKYESQNVKFEQWLQTGAHSVWMSEGSMMSMAHMHSAKPPLEDESYRFNFFDKKTMNPGLQKMWVQTKFDSVVHTFPFVFEYNPKFKTDC